MLKIYLARHGQNEDNAKGILGGRRDEPLSNVGIKQAEQLGSNIKKANLKFDAVYSSPLIRAYATAKIVTDTLGVDKPQILDNLIERDFGVMTGKKLDDIERLCTPDIIKTDSAIYFLSPDGAETFP